MKNIMLILITIFSLPTYAQQITLRPANEEDQGIQLSVSLSDGQTTMPLAGEALGTKKVGLSNYKVAINEFFCEKPQNLDRTYNGIYASLKNVGKMAFRVTLLRGVDSDLIESSINDAIRLNLSQPEQTTYQADIQIVTDALLEQDSISYGDSIAFVAYPDKNQVLYQNVSGETRMLRFSGVGFVYKLFAVWFGQQEKSESVALKTLLLRVPKVTAQ